VRRYAEVIGTDRELPEDPDKDTALSLMGESRGMALLMPPPVPLLAPPSMTWPWLALGRGEC